MLLEILDHLVVQEQQVQPVEREQAVHLGRSGPQDQLDSLVHQEVQGPLEDREPQGRRALLVLQGLLVLEVLLE